MCWHFSTLIVDLCVTEHQLSWPNRCSRPKLCGEEVADWLACTTPAPYIQRCKKLILTRRNTMQKFEVDYVPVGLLNARKKSTWTRNWQILLVLGGFLPCWRLWHLLWCTTRFTVKYSMSDFCIVFLHAKMRFLHLFVYSTHVEQPIQSTTSSPHRFGLEQRFGQKSCCSVTQRSTMGVAKCQHIHDKLPHKVSSKYLLALES